MSTSAYERIPHLRGYEDALRRFKETKPIRGIEPSVTPLGARRDHMRFAIRLAHNGDVECLHYDVLTVVFHKPVHGDDPATERITVFFQKTWVHSADCYFIYELLRHYLSDVVRVHSKAIRMCRHHGASPIVFAGLGDAKVTTMTMIAHRKDNTIEPTQPVLVQGRRINRKAANNIRAKYGQFYRYFKGMIALRRESYSDNITRYTLHARQYVQFSNEEFDRASSEDTTSPFFNVYNPANKPALNQTIRHYGTAKDGSQISVTVEIYPKWLESATAFIDKISTPDTDSNQTEQFAIAFTLVGAAAVSRDSLYMNSVSKRRFRTGFIRVGVRELQATLDEIIFKYHSKEVFETHIMPEGQVPSNKYDNWIDR